VKEPAVADEIDPRQRSTENMEYRIAEPALWVLDHVGRMCRAIAAGDWDEVEHNATRIATRAEQLTEAATEAAQERRPRAVAVVGMMTAKNNPENRLFRYAAGVPGPDGMSMAMPTEPAATGKTTSTMHLGTQPGPGVLLVDTDPQPDAATMLGRVDPGGDYETVLLDPPPCGRDLIDPADPFRRGA
jgi:hypothetical protein